MTSEKKPNDTPRGRGGRGNGGRGRGGIRGNNNTTHLPAAIKFDGMCKKELAGKVIIFSESKALMSAQYIRFETAVYNAAGKALPALATAIDLKRPLILKDFISDDSHNPMDYTTVVEGKTIIDVKIKKIYDDAEAQASKDTLENYNTYRESAMVFFYRIKGQIDPELTTRIETSNGWPAIKKSCDPGGLMKLLQAVCVHGTDRDYYPERLIKSINTVFTSKQGKQSPNEFKETMLSNMQVLCKVAGADIFGLFPKLQKFIIDKCDDIKFEHKELATQSEGTKKDLSDNADAT